MENLLKYALIALIAFGVVPEAGAQKRREGKADRETADWRYELESQGVGAQGTVQIKVWSYSKFPETAQEQAKKNSVHGVCFRGYGGSGGVQGKEPLVTPAQQIEHKEFFDKFFKDGGDYLRFVHLTGDHMVGPGDLIKVGKKEYKVGVVVSVDYQALRKYLESQKVIQSLGGMF